MWHQVLIYIIDYNWIPWIYMFIHNRSCSMGMVDQNRWWSKYPASLRNRHKGMLTTTVSLKICDIKYVLNILPTTVSFCVQVCTSFVSSLWNILPIYPKLIFRTVVGYALLIAMAYKSIYNCFFNWAWSLELMFGHTLVDSLDIQFKFDKNSQERQWITVSLMSLILVIWFK